MKKLIFTLLALCLVLAGCSNAEPAATQASEPVTETTAVPETASEPESTAAPITVSPVPQVWDRDNCTLPVSLLKGDAYVDDEGAMQMRVMVYTCDLYDMADIAALSPGDILVIWREELRIDTLQRLEDGSVVINDSVELRTNEDGVYYPVMQNDHPAYYPLTQATYPVSPDFEFTDSAIPGEEKTFYPGDFLVEDTGIDYNFTPYNTTIRIENGKVIAMNRVYIP